MRHFGSDAYGLILNVIETFVAVFFHFEIKQFGNISFFRSFVVTNVEENAKKGGFVSISKRVRSRHSHFCSEK